MFNMFNIQPLYTRDLVQDKLITLDIFISKKVLNRILDKLANDYLDKKRPLVDY